MFSQKCSQLSPALGSLLHSQLKSRLSIRCICRQLFSFGEKAKQCLEPFRWWQCLDTLRVAKDHAPLIGEFVG
jgi:hypothetical protein